MQYQTERLQKNNRFSEQKIQILRQEFERQITEFRHLTIYAVGSIGRLEANEHSDLDAFFVSTAPKGVAGYPENSRLKQIRLFSQLIDIAQKTQFPELSNDGQFLEILSLEDMGKKFGAPEDDYDNLFTARMLLLLESKCLYGETVYDEVLDAVLAAYFKDFDTHKSDFRPTILMNDIVRYWKTLCLNLENRRISSDGTKAEVKKFRQGRIKLKYSRMLTCFSSVIAIGARGSSITKESVKEICKLTPLERLQIVEEQHLTEAVMTLYSKFLDFLETQGKDEKFVKTMLDEADDFSELLYNILARTVQTEMKRLLL